MSDTIYWSMTKKSQLKNSYKNAFLILTQIQYILSYFPFESNFVYSDEFVRNQSILFVLYDNIFKEEEVR